MKDEITCGLIFFYNWLVQCFWLIDKQDVKKYGAF